jgi:putative ABC transport system permease protein
VEIFGDMNFVLRRLRHSTSFVFVTLATLAISMGAATTMFTVVNAFLLSSLPYQNADRLVMVWNSQQEGSKQESDQELPLSAGVFTDLRERAGSFEQIAAFLPESVNVTEGGEATRIHALFVTGDFFPLLRRQAAVGRTLGPEDERPDAPPVVVISHGLWQRHFGSDPGVLDRTLEFGGRVRDVVGVLPADFRFSESLVASDPGLSKPVDIWAPFGLGASAHERGFHYLTTIGSLKPEVTLLAAQEELNAYATMAAEQYPDTDEHYGINVVLLRDQIFGHLRPALLTLWAATSVILLIACVNLATLLMARMQTGQRETAVRLALGASRTRILGESLAESVGLSMVGGLLSLAVAFVATRLLTVLNPVNVFQSYPPQIDLRVILFTIGLSLVAGLLFGAYPAVRASRTDSATGLGEASARLTSRSRLAFSVLVASQIALATTLLIGMGLSFKSFHALLRADLGLDREKVVTFDLFLAPSQYRDTSRKVGFLRELLDRTKALPGVESVGMNYALPFSGVNPSNGFEVEGRQLKAGENPSANLGLVNPDYFETLGIPLLRGRSFLESDTAEATLVAIVDEQMVKQYFGSENPLGRRISIASDDKLTIVGVVGAVKHDALEEIARPYVYLPYRQRSYMFTSFAIRTSLEKPLSLAHPMRALVSDLDKGVPISNLSTLEGSYRSAISPQRFSLLLMSAFAGISLLLTLVGTYGAMAFLVRQREQEAGIRMALGAEPKQIFGLILKQGLALSLVGTTIGLGIAVAAGKIMANLAYGVGTLDFLVFSIVPAITLLAAFVAYYPPARSLSRVHPSSSLRSS